MMICPNGCTHDDDSSAEMEFGFNSDGKPAYICGLCGTHELLVDRGRL